MNTQRRMTLLVIAATALGCRPPRTAFSSPTAAACASALHPDLRIQGTVRDTSGAPIHGVRVDLPGNCLLTATDSHGRYVFKGVPLGRVAIRAAYPGYCPQRLEVQTDTAEHRVVFLDFVLPPCTITLSP